jgi:hypothetical protein
MQHMLGWLTSDGGILLLARIERHGIAERPAQNLVVASLDDVPVDALANGKSRVRLL